MLDISVLDELTQAENLRSKGWIALRPLQQKMYYAPKREGARLFKGVAIDTETTGTNPKVDEVISVAIVAFEYYEDGTIYRVYDTYEGYQQPSIPIPEDSFAIHGISDEDVEGKNFNLEKINYLIKYSDFIVAHNAVFDRPMVAKITKVADDRVWYCTCKQIEWKKLYPKIESAQLRDVAALQGFCYTKHEALPDTLAVVETLTHKLPDNRSVLSHLLDTVDEDKYLVKASWRYSDTLKYLVKPFKYDWNGEERYYHKLFDTIDSAQVSASALKNLVKENERTPEITIERLLRKDRFKG